MHLTFAEEFNLKASVTQDVKTKTLYVWQGFYNSIAAYFPFYYNGWKVKVIDNEKFKL